jgi:hypothetical protein
MIFHPVNLSPYLKAPNGTTMRQMEVYGKVVHYKDDTHCSPVTFNSAPHPRIHNTQGIDPIGHEFTTIAPTLWAPCVSAD